MAVTVNASFMDVHRASAEGAPEVDGMMHVVPVTLLTPYEDLSVRRPRLVRRRPVRRRMVGRGQRVRGTDEAGQARRAQPPAVVRVVGDAEDRARERWAALRQRPETGPTSTTSNDGVRRQASAMTATPYDVVSYNTRHGDDVRRMLQAEFPVPGRLTPSRGARHTSASRALTRQ